MVLVIFASSCSMLDDDTGPARIRVLNISSGYTSLDLYSNNVDDDTDTDAERFSDVSLNEISPYLALDADEYTLKFRRSGVTGDLQAQGVTLANSSHTTYVAYGALNGFSVLAINEDVEAPSSGFTKLTILNTKISGSFDVYLTGASDSLDDVLPTLAGIGPGGNQVVTSSSGTFRLRVTAAGSKTDLRLDVPSISLPSEGVVSIVLTDPSNGVLVNAVVLPQEGQPSFYDNANSAQLRVLNFSNAYDSIDLYTNNGDSETDSLAFTGIARDSTSSYTALKADSYALKFRSTGVAGNLSLTQTTLTENSHSILVTYGALDHFSILAINEDVVAPNAGFSMLRIFNTTGSETLDLYLSGPTDSLTALIPAIGAIAPGAESTPLTIAAGNYRLRITATGSKTDIRLDVPVIVLQSQGVASLVVVETTGGILVNAVLIPQQDVPVVYNNGMVHIRGAVGLSSGSAVTVNLAGVDLLTRRPARSFIADGYATLPAGNAAISVYVDDVNVAVGNRALQAGMEYTLLVWDNGGAPTMTLLQDDNHPPPTGYAKLRLINGMSGLRAPLNLAVQYSPVAEYIDVGTASVATQTSAGTDLRLDLLNAQTFDTVLTRDYVTFQSTGVYTFFAAGGGSGAVAGTLRRDR